MNMYLFGVLLLVAIVLLVLTFTKKQVVIGVFTGIFFMILGVICWTGLSYVASTTITTNASSYLVVDNYANWSNPVIADWTDTEIVGTSFVLLGLFLLIVSIVMSLSAKNKIDMDDDDNHQGGRDGSEE